MGGRRSLLLVEDEMVLAMSESRQLEREGYKVVLASSGERALEAVEMDPPIDLVLMDINLGEGMDGTETAERILKNHDIPVLFLSSHTEKEIVEKTERITNYGYVVKNSNFTVLDASIKMALKLFNAQKTILKDMTARKKLENEIAESEIRFGTAFRNAPIGVSLTELDGRLTTVNEAFCRMLGYSMEEIDGSNFLDLTHPDDVEMCREYATRLRAGDIESARFEKRYVHKDGYPIWTDIAVAVMRDSSGVPVHHIAYLMDITAWKLQKDALVRSEAELRNALARIGRGEDGSIRDEFNYSLFAENKTVMLIIDPATGAIVDANPTACAFYGSDAATLTSMRITDINTLPADEVRAEMANAVSEKRNSFLFRHRTGDGSIRDVEVYSSPVRYRGRRILFSIIFDVTEKKQFQSRLGTLMKELEHRVKNSLGIVSGLLDIAESKVSDPGAIGVLADAQLQLRAMSAIYERLYLTESVESIEFGTYVEELARSIFDTLSRASGRISLSVLARHIRVDTQRAVSLGLILNELLTNALKYAFPDDRPGAIEVVFEETDGAIRLTVADDGVGLKDPTIPEVSSTMGMTLIRLLAKQIGASVESGSARGTRISIVAGIPGKPPSTRGDCGHLDPNSSTGLG